MKILKFLLTAAIFVSFFAFVTKSYATEPQRNIVLPKDTVVNHDYFAAGDTVTISGTVNGDAYVAGGIVVVEGTINGDLLAGGGTITVTGKIRDDLRVAGGRIVISGDIGRNVTTVGGDVTVADQAVINGSFAGGVGNLSIFSPIKKDVNIGAGNALIANTVTGDINAGVGQLSFTPKASVGGSLTYWSDTQAELASSQIAGKVIRYIPERKTQDIKPARPAVFFTTLFILFTGIGFLSSLATGFLLIVFLPGFINSASKNVTLRPIQSFGVGLITVILSPFIIITLFLTIIGIPLAVLISGVMLILMYISKIIFSIAFGQKILMLLDKKARIGWSLLLGLTAYYVLTIIPIVGFIFWMGAGLTGLGALLINIRNTSEKRRVEK